MNRDLSLKSKFKAQKVQSNAWLIHKMGILSHFMNKPSIIESLVLRVLKPLVHLLMRLEVSHAEFSEMAKKAYVDVAREKFSLPNRKMTTSRVAVLTGLSRKEVVRLDAHKGHGSQLPKVKHNRAARVVTGWLQDQEFCHQGGGPKDLPLRGECSFATLVERYSGDITAGAIRDELLRTGIVKIIKDDKLHLMQSAYIPSQDEMEQFGVLSECAERLLSTGVFNVTKDPSESSRYQRQLTHRQVNRTLAEKFSHHCKNQSQNLLIELDTWLNQQLQNTDFHADQDTVSVGLGVYYFEDKDHEE